MLNGRRIKKKNKYIQFVIILRLLKHGRPMTNFDMKEFFEFWKYTNALKNHSKHIKMGGEW
jgi:hypothetical protein